MESAKTLRDLNPKPETRIPNPETCSDPTLKKRFGLRGWLALPCVLPVCQGLKVLRPAPNASNVDFRADLSPGLSFGIS